MATSASLACAAAAAPAPPAAVAMATSPSLRGPLRASGESPLPSPTPSPGANIAASGSQEFLARQGAPEADVVINGALSVPPFRTLRGVIYVRITDASPGERVRLMLKRCVAFGEDGNRTCDVAFTDYRVCFVSKFGPELTILNAAVERIRALPIDKNVPNNIKVPDGTVRSAHGS